MSEKFPTADQLKSELSRINSGKSFRRAIISTISALLVVVAIAVLLSTLFMPVLRVTGTSMEPTLLNDQLLVCNKQGEFETGDIIAFYYNNKVLLKRVIGLPGDVIDIDKEGNVYINGELLDEPYLPEKAFGECDIELPYQVGDSRLFVMGDNRSVSVDSRTTTVGCVPDEAIVGKVVLRLWPLTFI